MDDEFLFSCLSAHPLTPSPASAPERMCRICRKMHRELQEEYCRKCRTVMDEAYADNLYAIEQHARYLRARREPSPVLAAAPRVDAAIDHRAFMTAIGEAMERAGVGTAVVGIPLADALPQWILDHVATWFVCHVSRGEEPDTIYITGFDPEGWRACVI